MKLSWTESLARACARRPWVTIAAWVAAMGIAIVLNFAWLGEALVTEVKPTNNPESNQAQMIIDQRLAKPKSEKTLDETIIVRSSQYTVDDTEFRMKVEQIYNGLTALDKDVVLGAATYYMTQAPTMVSADRHATMIPFTMPADGDKTVGQVYALDRYAGGSFEIYYTGSASFSADTMKLAESQMQMGETIGIGAALIILAIVFGAVTAALLPMVIGGVAIVVAFGLTAIVGQFTDLTFAITNMITMMGLAVGIDYSLFILTRFREERKRGLAKDDAIGKAGANASRAVFFSGMTVVLALCGLVLFPLSIFISMGIGAILVVLTAIAASMTLLPAILGLLGDKVNAIRIPFVQREKTGQSYETPTGFWAGMTRVVTRVPALSVIIVVAILGTAAIPYLNMKSGMSGITDLPDNLRAKQGYLVMQKEFKIGMDSPAVIVVDGDVISQDNQQAISKLQAAIKTNPAFSGSVVAPYPDKNVAVVYASVSGDPMSTTTMDAVAKLRSDYIPQSFANSSAQVLVTGYSAGILDFNATTEQYTPIIFLFVLALSFIILTLAFRSLVISTTAIIMNLLSVGASYGLLVLVFQEGVGASLFHFRKVDVIESWLPLFLFALLFGLSMDYHVFLLSRVRERFKKTGDNVDAVSFGLRSTGRLITGAALIMVAVFGGFALGDMVMFQQLGFGLGVAILLDATLVRCVLVPATMTMLGSRNWYLPRWLEWLPNVSLGENSPDVAAEAVPAVPTADRKTK